MKRFVLVALCSAITFGCASSGGNTVAQSPQSEPALAAVDEGLVCTREKKTGSNFTVKRCVTKEQADREREETQAAMQQMQKSGPRVDNQ